MFDHQMISQVTALIKDGTELGGEVNVTDTSRPNTDLTEVGVTDGEEQQMPNNLYARQAPMNLNIPPSVTIVGCGGIGSWVAILAAMSGVGTLYLFDPDVVEESNRNRLPFCQGSIGQPKVEVVKDFILSIRPDCIIASIAEKLEGIYSRYKAIVRLFYRSVPTHPETVCSYNALKALDILL